MLPAFVSKRIITWGLKKIFERRRMKKIRDYVEKPNEIDVAVKDLTNRIVLLEKNSHPQADFVCCKCGCKAKRKINKRRK